MLEMKALADGKNNNFPGTSIFANLDRHEIHALEKTRRFAITRQVNGSFIMGIYGRSFSSSTAVK